MLYKHIMTKARPPKPDGQKAFATLLGKLSMYVSRLDPEQRSDKTPVQVLLSKRCELIDPSSSCAFTVLLE
jgi:hypothetical protein